MGADFFKLISMITIINILIISFPSLISSAAEYFSRLSGLSQQPLSQSSMHNLFTRMLIGISTIISCSRLCCFSNFSQCIWGVPRKHSGSFETFEFLILFYLVVNAKKSHHILFKSFNCLENNLLQQTSNTLNNEAGAAAFGLVCVCYVLTIRSKALCSADAVAERLRESRKQE